MKNHIIMPLVGEDGNAFAILARFARAARQAGWTDEEIAEVRKEATSGDYNHLLGTIMEHVEEPDEDDDDE